MERITDRLVDFAASSLNKTSLMYGLTTPWLCDAGIDATITGVLNAAAAPIMAARGIPVVDTHSPITDQCGAAPVSSCFDLDECYCPHCAGHYDFLANDVIKAMWDHKFSWPFQTPVDTIRLSIPDYFKVIRKPMDLGKHLISLTD